MIINPYRFAAGGGDNGLLTGLVSYWKLDEASGTRFDSHGSFDLAENNAPGSVTGVINDALSLNGSNQYLSRSNDLLTGTGACSFATWVNTTVDTGCIISIGLNATGTIISIGLEGSSIYQRGQGGNTAIWGNVVTGSGWTHMAIVKPVSVAASGILLYVNGSLRSMTGSSGSTVINLGAGAVQLGLGIAGSFYASSYFNGAQDEIGIWSTELTADDITALYNAGNGLPYGSFTS